MLLISRPRFWLYTAGPFIVGTAFASLSAFLSFSTWLQLLFFLIPANVYLYGINDIFDGDTDKYNKKKDERETRKTKSHIFYVISSALLFIPYLFFLDWYGKALLGLFFFLSTAYSVPPIRFKAKPFVDSVSNILYVIPGFIAYSQITGNIVPIPIIFVSWLWVIGMHLYSAIPDIEPDKKAGLLTTAIFFGRTKSLYICSIVWLLSALLSQYYLLFIYPVLAIVTLYKDEKKLYWFFPYINGIIGFFLFWHAIWLM